ncbi:transcriptional regulator [Nocardiopsis rhodophaea]|uniref:helix-turn-helix domain-containing protein n=1 Tax=Nocardiopsis rhodophaea TaxID=280238 RepID=UPI0031D1E7E8
MPITREGLSPGQRVAWYRVRRGMSQEVLAGLIGRTADWLGKIENDRAPLDRLSVIRSLADALDVSVLDLIDEGTDQQAKSGHDLEVQRVRSALLDSQQLSPLLARLRGDSKPPDLRALRRDIDYVMSAYQASAYGRMLRRLPDLLTRTHAATYEYGGDEQVTAQRLSALANQAAATILTKLGETDLAWISAQRGLKAAEQSGDDAIIGSLFRSVVHSLHSHQQPQASAEMTQQAADYIHDRMDWSSPNMLSIYGTLLLAGAVAAARSDDRLTTKAYLDEAQQAADRQGTDCNHLWTAFGPTNVSVHRVVTAMALGDVGIALDIGPRIDTSTLPVERRVRHAFEVANAHLRRNQQEDALAQLLKAERLSAEQVHHHVIPRQLVARMLRHKAGKQDQRLGELARRMKLL